MMIHSDTNGNNPGDSSSVKQPTSAREPIMSLPDWPLSASRRRYYKNSRSSSNYRPGHLPPPYSRPPLPSFLQRNHASSRRNMLLNMAAIRICLVAVILVSVGHQVGLVLVHLSSASLFLFLQSEQQRWQQQHLREDRIDDYHEPARAVSMYLESLETRPPGHSHHHRTNHPLMSTDMTKCDDDDDATLEDYAPYAIQEYKMDGGGGDCWVTCRNGSFAPTLGTAAAKNHWSTSAC